MRTALLVAVAAALAWTGGAMADTDQPPCSTAQCADVTGDGVVNINDVLLVVSNWGELAERNPCVEYRQATEPVLLWGTMTVPPGPTFLIPGDHPAYAPLRSGTPWNLRTC